MKFGDYVEMTVKERAKAIVGDMPWVTEHLTPKQLKDMPKQIEACLDAAVSQEKERCAAYIEKWHDNVRNSDIAEGIRAMRTK